MNYVLNEAKMFADITDGVAIIINSETGIYYGMNELGTSVYEALVSGASDEDILKSLKTMAGCPSDIEEKFNTFIKALLNWELIIEANSSNADVNIDSNIAKTSNFELKVNEYNDAQELLLSDPIHEVKEETGWTPEKESIGYTKEETLERESKLED